MKRTCAALLMVSGLILGQGEKLHFEVCDVQVSKITDDRLTSAQFLPGGRVDVRGMSMKVIIAALNKVPEDMVSGPAWMATARYDIVAKADPASTQNQLFEMARNMLVERFKLVMHTEKKVTPAYALLTGKRALKLTPATDHANHGCVAAPRSDQDPVGMTHRDCRNMTMAELAEVLPQMAPAYFEGLQAVDMTGIQGSFDFRINWMGRAAYNAAVAGNAGTSGNDPAVSIFDGMEEIGLRLESRKLPMDKIVVDSIQRTPTAN